MDIYKASLKFHEKHRGKLSVESKVALKTKKDLSLAYTPGVAQPCLEIHKNPELVFKYTIKQNCVAVVSDGSAVLGLGNIGAKAAIPVMEGKAVLFKEFAGIDAFPICIESQDSEEIINIVKNIAPVFGGINLEDISAPRCFYIEEQLQNLGIPVFHDDQHGTAVVVLAGLMNACKVTGRKMEDLKVAMSGAGAAGTAIAKMLLAGEIKCAECHPVKDIVVVDSKGIIYEGRPGLNDEKIELSKITNRRKEKGTLADAMKGKDVFIGVSKGGIVTEEMVKVMNKKPIVMAMANPVPEIMPDLAKKAGAAVVCTGRSDFPNQINNVLGFPGIFRGALDARAKVINTDMKIAAAKALAAHVKKPTGDRVIPSPLDKKVAKEVAKAVRKAAMCSGACE